MQHAGNKASTTTQTLVYDNGTLQVARTQQTVRKHIYIYIYVDIAWQPYNVNTVSTASEQRGVISCTQVVTSMHEQQGRQCNVVVAHNSSSALAPI